MSGEVESDPRGSALPNSFPRVFVAITVRTLLLPPSVDTASPRTFVATMERASDGETNSVEAT